ncbi:MAG TPA: arginase family protein [Thermoanaerobaculia bacterium]|nr:arginase family protein [Thermoanaerobaculia bacterium]
MNLTLIQVPYDSGHFGTRMGRGPLQLVEQGLADTLERAGHGVEVVPVRLDGFLTEVTSAPGLHRLVAEHVSAARSGGRLPVVLSGNCNTAVVGSLAGIGPAGVVWMDAHGDLNTPDTTLSGFFDGMAISVAMRKAWPTLTANLPGFTPLNAHNLIHVGARDFDPPELDVIESLGIARIQVEDLRRDGVAGALAGHLSNISRWVDQAYIHMDLDVLDPTELRANVFSVPGGLTVAEMAEVVRMTGRHLKIAAAGITAYDPDQDPEGRGARVAERLIEALAGTGPV